MTHSCPACHGMVADAAKACVHCGHPVQLSHSSVYCDGCKYLIERRSEPDWDGDVTISEYCKYDPNNERYLYLGKHNGTCPIRPKQYI